MRNQATNQRDSTADQVVTAGASGEIECPVCGEASVHAETAPNWGEWRRCVACTLEFTNPRQLPDRPEVVFQGAYTGNRFESGFYDFRKLLNKRDALIETPDLWYWTPAYPQVLDWLKTRLPRGATVLELGCGPGFFLHAMRREGFEAVGLDVAEVTVEKNRKDGFRVWHGTLDTMPRDWVRADAIVVFFIMHHLENPLGLLNSIKTRWPHSPLAVAQYGPGSKDPVRGAPPRNLTRWNSVSMATAFRTAGYNPKVCDLPSSGGERRIFGTIREILRPTMAVPWLYRFNKRIERRLLPKMMKPLSHEAEVILTFGEPGEIGSSPK